MDLATPPAAAHSPELDLALSEIAVLRQCLEGALIGDRIIRDQFAGATEPMYLWAHKQAAHNIACLETSLKDSRTDFPWEGWDFVKAEAKAVKVAVRASAGVEA